MSPRRPVPEKKQQSGLPSWVILAAVVVIAVVGVVVGIDFVSKLQPPAPAGPTTVSSAGIVRSGRTEGDPNAPIAFVEYSDFQ